MSGKSNDLKLTIKQERFCLEYLIDLNAKQAAIRAGYSKKGAECQASRMLSNVKVQQYIYKHNTKRIKETKIDVNFVLTELEKIANSDLKDAFNSNGTLSKISDIPEYLRKSISSFEVIETFEMQGKLRVWTGYLKKIKLWSKDRALENLGKHLKLFTEKVELSNPDGSLRPIINITMPSNNREKD